MRRLAALSILIGVPLLIGCSGGTTEPGPTPAIGVTLSGPVNLVQGQSNSAVATVSRVAFSGPVRLSVSDLPAGVTGKFEPATLPDGVASSMLTLEASPTAAVGSATMTVTASGSGVPTAATSTTVSVSEAPGFTMALAPTSLSVEQGKNGVATVTFDRRGGFAGPIALSVTGSPGGVAASFSDPAPTGASSALTLSVDKSVTVGSYSVTVSGQGTPGTQVATLTLNVTAPQPTPSFALTVNPGSMTMAAGASSQATVGITRAGGFTGAVSLSVEGQPAGVSASFDDPAPTGATATVTLSSLSNTAPGTYGLLVRGTAPGLADQTVGLSLTVLAASGGFTLSVNPASLEVQVGQSGTATVTVLKVGSFAGSVTLSATSVPTGVTVTFSPASASTALGGGVEASSTAVSVMTLQVAGAVASGNYPLQVVGRSAGQPDQSAALLLVVNPLPGTGNTSFAFCDAGLPIWFASRNGSGPWTRVIGVQSAGGTSYGFDVTASDGGAAFVRGSNLIGYSVTVLQGTQAELQQFGNAQCRSSLSGSKTVSGTVSGVGPDDQVTIALGRASESASAAAPGFTLKRVQSGPVDLIALRSSSSSDGPPFRSVPLGTIVRPGTDYPDGSTIPVLDFSSGGFAPATANLTLANLGSDLTTLLLTYQSPTTEASLQYGVDESNPSQVMYGLPAAQQPVGGVHNLTLLAAPSGGGDGRTWVGWFRALANRTVSLAEFLTAPTVDRLGGSYPRFQAVGPVQASYDDLLSFELRQDLSDGTWVEWTVQSSAAPFPGGTYRLELPDFTAVAGWSSGWALLNGVVARWVVTGNGISSGGVVPVRTDGATLQTATRSGSVVP